jgi:hypothetical protein
MCSRSPAPDGLHANTEQSQAPGMCATAFLTDKCKAFTLVQRRRHPSRVFELAAFKAPRSVSLQSRSVRRWSIKVRCHTSSIRSAHN